MKTDKLRQTLCPLLAAMIWGTAFVAQSMGAQYVSAFTFNTVRSLIGSAALFLLIVIIRIFGKKQPVSVENRKNYNKKLLLGGIVCGVILTIATSLQQLGLEETSAGKSGFITALYIVLVPILGIFLKKKAPLIIWLSVLIAVAGLYLLCVKEDFTISRGDFYVFLCAFAFSCHILVIDYFTRFVDCIELSCAQFAVTTVLSSIFMFIFEKPDIASIMQCIYPLLYVGIFSSGVAYTLQIVAQRGANPTVVSLLLSLESVFATLSGALILNEVMTTKEYIGCALMFIAVLTAQLPSDMFKKKKKAQA